MPVCKNIAESGFFKIAAMHCFAIAATDLHVHFRVHFMRFCIIMHRN